MLNKKFIVAAIAVIVLFLGIFSFAQGNTDDETNEENTNTVDKDNDKTQQSKEVEDTKPAITTNNQGTQPAVNTQTNEQNNTVVETAKKDVTITFNSNGGSSVIAQKIIEGGTAIKPNDPTWAGHKFLGWSYSNGTWNFTWAINDNLTLTAQWETIEQQPVADVYTIKVGSIGADAFAPEGRALILKNNIDITSSVTTLKSGDTILGSYVASIQGIRINKAQFSNYSSFQVVLNDGTTHQVK